MLIVLALGVYGLPRLTCAITPPSWQCEVQLAYGLGAGSAVVLNPMPCLLGNVASALEGKTWGVPTEPGVSGEPLASFRQ